MHSKGNINTKGPSIKWNKFKKSTLKFFIFQKNWKNGGGSIRGPLLLLFEIEYLGNMKS